MSALNFIGVAFLAGVLLVGVPLGWWLCLATLATPEDRP